MAMTADEIATLIRAGLPEAEVTVEDLAGDGNHYRAHVVAPAFRGISRAAAWAASCTLWP
jgi:acid stress-induced BolA-like protein IbaG/YrbA